MIPRSLGEVARLSRSSMVRGEAARAIGGVVIDSRLASPGDLFVALEGERCHGIEFAADAISRGAAAVLCDPGFSRHHEGASIEAASPLDSLILLASEVRRQESDRIPAIAVTGSVGKTTTCKMIGSLVGGVIRTHSPRASFNNQLGVPVTILEAAEETRLLVLELGTSAPGEIATLVEIARPSHGVITAVSAAHLQGLGDLEGVRREKFSLLERLDGKQAWAPVEWRQSLGEAASNLCWTGPAGDLEVRQLDGKRIEVFDRLRGRHLQFEWTVPARWALRCLESALAVALQHVEDEEQLQEGIQRIELPELRHEVRSVEGVDLVLDCYNSSPLALRVAIEELAQSSAKRRIAVVGTMEELGESEQQLHHQAGKNCASLGIDLILPYGRGARWIAEGVRDGGGTVVSLEDGSRGAETILDLLREGDRVLFKASRKEALETLAGAVEARLTERGAST